MYIKLAEPPGEYEDNLVTSSEGLQRGQDIRNKLWWKMHKLSMSWDTDEDDKQRSILKRKGAGNTVHSRSACSDVRLGFSSQQRTWTVKVIMLFMLAWSLLTCRVVRQDFTDSLQISGSFLQMLTVEQVPSSCLILGPTKALNSDLSSSERQLIKTYTLCWLKDNEKRLQSNLYGSIIH